MDKLCCCFFGDETVDDEFAAGGSYRRRIYRQSGGMVPFLDGFKMVIKGGGMDFWGDVVGSPIVLGCFGDEGLDREGPGSNEDFRCWSSGFFFFLFIILRASRTFPDLD